MFWLELFSFVILLTAVIRNWFLIQAPHVELWDNSVHQFHFQKIKNQVKPSWHTDILDFLTFWQFLSVNALQTEEKKQNKQMKCMVAWSWDAVAWRSPLWQFNKALLRASEDDCQPFSFPSYVHCFSLWAWASTFCRLSSPERFLRRFWMWPAIMTLQKNQATAMQRWFCLVEG